MFVFSKNTLSHQRFNTTKKSDILLKKVEGELLSKFNIGELVKINDYHSMAGLVGIVTAYYKENHTYLVRFSRDLELLLKEEAITIEKR